MVDRTGRKEVRELTYDSLLSQECTPPKISRHNTLAPFSSEPGLTGSLQPSLGRSANPGPETPGGRSYTPKVLQKRKRCIENSSKYLRSPRELSFDSIDSFSDIETTTRQTHDVVPFVLGSPLLVTSKRKADTRLASCQPDNNYLAELPVGDSSKADFLSYRGTSFHQLSSSPPYGTPCKRRKSFVGNNMRASSSDPPSPPFSPYVDIDAQANPMNSSRFSPDFSEVCVVRHANSEDYVDVESVDIADEQSSDGVLADVEQSPPTTPINIRCGKSQENISSTPEKETGLKRIQVTVSHNPVAPPIKRSKERATVSVEIPVAQRPERTHLLKLRTTKLVGNAAEIPTQAKRMPEPQSPSKSFVSHSELTENHPPSVTPVVKIAPSPSRSSTSGDMSSYALISPTPSLGVADIEFGDAGATSCAYQSTEGSQPKGDPVDHVDGLPSNTSDIIDISDDSSVEEEEYTGPKGNQQQGQTIDSIEAPNDPSNDLVDISDDEIMDLNTDWAKSSLPISSEQLQPLSNCLARWESGYDWEDTSESNPLWALTNDVLMGQEVMDSTISYLAYQALLTSKTQSRRVCVIPPSLYGAIIADAGLSLGLDTWIRNVGPDGPNQLFGMRDMVWMSSRLPTRVILPVIDPRHMHCYLWYGDIQLGQNGEAYDCQLHYLDSLPRPPPRLLEERLSNASMVLRYLLPQINGNVTGVHRHIEGYRQAPGSLDCGFFVCQATSALVCFDDDALKSPTMPALVRSRIRLILHECHDHALLHLSQGYMHLQPIILHQSARISPPPWLKQPNKIDTQPSLNSSVTRPRWVTPEYNRSLSEPLCPDGPDKGQPVSWEAVYGPATLTSFSANGFSNAQSFVQNLGNRNINPPPGLLAGVVTRLPGHFQEAVLLKDDEKPIPWLSGIHVVGGRQEEELECPGECLGVARMGHALSYLQEGRERSLAVLTGEHKRRPLRLNWAAESLDIEEEWLCPSLDIDSLSLTASDPQFIMAGSLHAYPPRASTLTTDNGLSVLVRNEKTPLSHIPNFTLLNLGLNNQFKANIFFPNYEKGQDAGGRYITMLSESDFTEWWEQVMLQAIVRVTAICPPELSSSCVRLYQELPKTYKAGQDRAVTGGRSFSGFKVMPELLNLVLDFARKIVDRTPRLAKYRGFFYHIFGINIKAVAEAIPTRLGADAILHVLQLYPIVDWSIQNPLDIVLDIGLEINARRDRLPLDVRDVTLLWKLEHTMRVMSSWRKPTIDAYVHSHVVGGLTAKPRSHIAGMFHRLVLYHKDKVNTYVHRDRSQGTGFSPMDGLSGSKTYAQEVARCLRAWSNSTGSYGCRMEFRCGPWAAAEILKIDPDVWKRRLLSAEAIVAIPTFAVVRLKTIMMGSYDWFFKQMQRLPGSDRSSEGVLLLASALTYAMHGLVKRPDDMSSSRAMAKDLQLVSRAIRYGMISVPGERLGHDLLRMDGHISIDQYPILKYVSRKNPAGARIKNSSERWGSGHAADATHETPPEQRVQVVWTEDDESWLAELIDGRLARWLWSKLPEQDRAQGTRAETMSGPLLLRKWPQVVGVGIRYATRKQTGGFDKTVGILLPPNWVLSYPTKQWESLDISVLEPIRDRIDDAPDHLRTAYCERIRERILETIHTWDFLPAAQKARVWGYDGSGRTRTYMVHRNPRRKL